MIGPHTCQKCGSNSVRVADSRPQEIKFYRRRRIACNKCQYRWSTFEIHQVTFDLLTKLRELWIKMKTAQDAIVFAIEDCKEVIEQQFFNEGENDGKKQQE